MPEPTRRTVHPDKGLPELGPELDQAWRTWLARHGLPDPLRICAHGPIVCDDEARTVAAWCKVQNEHGSDMIDPDDQTQVLREWVTVQLEAPALPIPPGYPIEVD